MGSGVQVFWFDLSWVSDNTVQVELMHNICVCSVSSDIKIFSRNCWLKLVSSPQWASKQSCRLKWIRMLQHYVCNPLCMGGLETQELFRAVHIRRIFLVWSAGWNFHAMAHRHPACFWTLSPRSGKLLWHSSYGEGGCHWITRKEFCVEEVQLNQLQTKRTDRDKDHLIATIEDLEFTMKTLSTEIDMLKLEVAEVQVQMKRAGVWRRRMRNEWRAEKSTRAKCDCVCSKLCCLFAGAVLFVAYLHSVAFAVWHACFGCVNLLDRAGALCRCLPMRCLLPALPQCKLIYRNNCNWFAEI